MLEHNRPVEEEPTFAGSTKNKHILKTYTAKIALAFAAIACMTVLVACGILAIVWEDHFQQYTRENMQRLATSLADQVAKGYEHYDGWYGGTLSSIEAVSSMYDTTTITITDADGQVIFEDSALANRGPRGSNPKGKEGTATAPIVVDGKQVGTVSVSVFGSSTLLTQPDKQFRDNSYQAVSIAALTAIVLAIIVGLFFARTLVRPINKITQAADAIREGDYAARANIQGDDEMARLGNTFDRMAASVEQNRNMERRLVTDVAHELRTPLMAVQATVEAMIDGVFEPDEERLETLNSEIRRLSRLVNALLKLSRSENRSTPMELSKVDLSELLEQVVSTHSAYIEDAGLKLIYEQDPHVYVKGNADNLRQAAANLISNAVRYTPEGGTITVIARKGDIMGQIIVKDTGIGLTPEEARMVFSRFWRADKGRTRDSGGLGIGLSVVKEIVDRHNGWVHVEGKPDEGSTFTIYIPLYQEDAGTSRSLPKILRSGN